jgi:hypothetical protein
VLQCIMAGDAQVRGPINRAMITICQQGMVQERRTAERPFSVTLCSFYYSTRLLDLQNSTENLLQA